MKGCLVHITLAILDDAAAVCITETKSVLPFPFPLVVFPESNVNMAIRPSLHPIPAPQPTFKVARVQTAVLAQFNSVSVASVTLLHLPGRQWAAIQSAKARFVLAAQVVKRFGGGCGGRR